MAMHSSKGYKPIKAWNKREHTVNHKGYILVKVPEHPKSIKGWYYEHRLVCEALLNRLLEPWETVHHLNTIKHDNSEINLFVCHRREHDHAHRLTALVA